MIVPSEKLLRKHWLYEWIDEEGIRKPGDYIKAVRKRGSFDRLRELSDNVFSDPTIPTRNAGSSILAGCKLDLSGNFTCPDFNCQAPIVDNLFGRVWHYFDSVVIDEPTLDERLFSGEDDVYDLLNYVKLLLYLRDIGAERYVQFTHKVGGMCSDHFRKHAEERGLGLELLFDEQFEREVVRKLKSEGHFNVSFRPDEGWYYQIRHPDTGLLSGVVAHSDKARRPNSEEVARDAYGRYCVGLISDVSASRALGLPLLQVAEARWTPEAAKAETVDDHIVALNLKLPVLTHVPVKEVLKYREDNSASFELLRSALRQAIREQIARGDSGSPEEVANAVITEYVQPELAKIEVQLSGIKKTLARKINAHIVVGGAAVGVGVIDSIPLLIGATAAAAAVSVAQIINKQADNKQAIEDSPWYFLWKARANYHRK